ncbi:hypothetical protein Y032_0030g2126 [Ancylostoma ceylanicum]|nr:hypothetical protein Y032_0030g2126 [Ancylostoma ceylanicum]
MTLEDLLHGEEDRATSLSCGENSRLCFIVREKGRGQATLIGLFLPSAHLLEHERRQSHNTWPLCFAPCESNRWA